MSTEIDLRVRGFRKLHLAKVLYERGDIVCGKRIYV